MEVGPGPRHFSPVLPTLLMGLQVMALAWFLRGVARGLGTFLGQGLAWEGQAGQPAVPGEASFADTSAHLGPCLGLHTAPDSGRERHGRGARSQEDPGEVAARLLGLLQAAIPWPEITASAPLHSCPRPELAPPGEWWLLPWERGLESPLLLHPQLAGGPRQGPGSAGSH